MFILKFVGAFLFYFIGGYLLYASLFAAIGAAVDNETDSQQFMTSSVYHSGCRPLHRRCCHEKPRITHGILEFSHPFHLSGCHACAYTVWCSCMGNHHFNGFTRRFLPFLHVVIR